MLEPKGTHRVNSFKAMMAGEVANREQAPVGRAIVSLPYAGFGSHTKHLQAQGFSLSN